MADVTNILHAMIVNYAGGHQWDHLDAKTCQRAIDEIETLRATIERLTDTVKSLRIDCAFSDKQWKAAEARLSQAGAVGVVDARQIAERVAGLVSLNKEAFAVEKAILAALAASPAATRGTPEPVYKAIERILDDHSAWIARPNDEVTRKIALAATIAAQCILEKMREYDTPAPESARGEALKARAYDQLKELGGWFQDGSETSIKINPDDATKTWHVTAGNRKGYGYSIAEALDNALTPTAPADGEKTTNEK